MPLYFSQNGPQTPVQAKKGPEEDKEVHSPSVGQVQETEGTDQIIPSLLKPFTLSSCTVMRKKAFENNCSITLAFQ